jgi:hypothetical protein
MAQPAAGCGRPANLQEVDLLKKGFMCTHCEYNWRGCHNPKRPSVTWDEGCKDFWSKGKPREPELERLSSEWVEGLDLRGLGKKKPKRKR